MNSIPSIKEHFTTPRPGPSWSRRIARMAAPALAALGLLSPQARAGSLFLDFSTNGGVTTAPTSGAPWIAVSQANANAGVTGIGGTGYNFTFLNVGSYQGGDAAQTLTRSGFHNGNNYATAKTFTLSGATPNKPVKLYACASWDGNPAGGYIVYGDTGSTGVKAQTVGNPGTTGTLANLTLIGTATADGSGVVTGELWGRNNATATGNAEGQVGAFVFVPTQTVTATAGANGSISPAGATDLFAGSSQAYTITANSGYHVADVLVDGISVGAVSDYTFTNIQANRTISASFAIDTTSYTLTATAGANGSISPSGAVSAFEGTSKLFTITPDTGYHINDVLVDGISVGTGSTYTFTNIQTSHTISASFAINTYVIDASAGSGGSISPDGLTELDYFESASYLITPNVGYYISTVLVDGVSVPVTPDVDGNFEYVFFDVTENHIITANFDNRTRVYLDLVKTATPYTSGWNPVFATQQQLNEINIPDVDGAGHGFTFGHVASYDNGIAAQPLTRSGFYNFDGTAFPHPFSLSGLTPGQTVALYACAAWDGNGAGAFIVYGNSGAAGVKAQTIGNPGTSPTLDNLTLIGTAVVDVNGVVSGNMYGSGGVASGAQGQIGGMVFAIEAPPVYTVATTAGANGTISPGGDVGVVAGDSQEFTFTPDSGFHVTDVLVDGVSQGAIDSYTFNIVTTDHTLSVSFAANTNLYTVTASAGANGTITPAGAVSVHQGTNKIFNITPTLGYHVADVLVDGISQGAVSTYTFTNVTASHTISASFAINTFTVTATAGANGTISPNGTSIVNYGDSQEFILTPASGYYVDTLTVDGVSIAAANSYTFTNITGNHTIAATFDNRTKLKLDFKVTTTPTTAGWVGVNGNYVADTILSSSADINGLGYDFGIAHVGAYDNEQVNQPLTRAGFYNFGQNANDHTFTLTGLNAGQSVALYGCAAWDGNARAGIIVYGDSGAAGVQALTVGTPGNNPTTANMTLIGTAIADGAGTVTGSLHGAGGVNSATEGQVGAFVFAISPGGSPPASAYNNWATTAPNNLSGDNALPGSDPDFDGVSNLIEFALNGSPISGSSTGLSFGKTSTVASVPGVLTLTIAVRNGAVFSASGNNMQSNLVDGITYTVEASNNLADWGAPVVSEVTGSDATAIQTGLPTPDSGWSYKTFRTDGSTTTDPGDFIRVGVQ